MKIPRISPAMAVALLALMMSTTGTAFAASKYLLTSTKQVKPSVLKQLRGASGATGAAGATGAPGAPGAVGAQGPAGPIGAQGVAGVSRAHGFVTIAGNIKDASAGVTARRTATGEYCVSVDSFDPDNIVAMLGAASGDAEVIYGDVRSSACPNDDAYINTYYRDAQGNVVQANSPFYVLLN